MFDLGENGESGDDVIEIDDEENYTDKKVKQRILSARDRVGRAHDQLYAERLVNPDASYSEQDVLFAWGNMVRAYVRDLGIFLNNDDLPSASQYRETVHLGEVVMIPQPAGDYDFSKVMYDAYDPKDLRRMWGFSRDTELPQPRTINFDGLMSIVERDNVLEERWMLCPNPREAPPNREYIETADRKPIPKHIYERALEVSDSFLNNIGIGVDVKAEDYTADSGPGL